MKTHWKTIMLVTVMVLVPFFAVYGGPYTERGINSYVEPNGAPANPSDPNAVINPIFRGWANGVANYEPAEPEYIDPVWMDLNMALGESWGNTAPEDHILDVVSLGDLYQEDINAGVPPGQITLSFIATIRNGKGYDFAVFENAIGPLCDDLYWWCELGYVEVSSNGVDFVRFPSVSLVPYDSGCYRIPDGRVIDITNVYNLAGKHPNVWYETAPGEDITGTPFDLSDLANDPNVLNGSVDLNNISYVRIVDIPGSGDFNDSEGNPIYDPWVTFGSGGFDLEAIGVLHPQEYGGDINLDGFVDYEDLEIFAQGWLSHFGQEDYLSRCDLAMPKDLIVDFKDFAVFADDWLKIEQWHFSF